MQILLIDYTFCYCSLYIVLLNGGLSLANMHYLEIIAYLGTLRLRLYSRCLRQKTDQNLFGLFIKLCSKRSML